PFERGEPFDRPHPRIVRDVLGIGSGATGEPQRQSIERGGVTVVQGREGPLVAPLHHGLYEETVLVHGHRSVTLPPAGCRKSRRTIITFASGSPPYRTIVVFPSVVALPRPSSAAVT